MNEKLIELVKTRIQEFELDIKRCMRNGSYSTIKFYEKRKQEQVEILNKLEAGAVFLPKETKMKAAESETISKAL